MIAPHLPVAVPEILAVGEPGFGYPERWSLVRWLDGSVPSVPEVGVPSEPSRSELAGDLAEVVAAFGAIDVPPDAQADPALQWYRGDPLATRDAPTRNAIDACRAISGLLGGTRRRCKACLSRGNQGRRVVVATCPGMGAVDRLNRVSVLLAGDAKSLREQAGCRQYGPRGRTPMRRDQARNADESGFPSPKPLKSGQV